MYLLDKGELIKAKKKIDHIIINDHSNYDALYLKGFICGLERNYKESEKYLLRVINKFPNHISALFNLAITLENLGNNIEANNCYEKITNLDPLNYKAYCNLGANYYKEKKYEIAKSLIQKSLEIKSDYCEAYVALGNVNIELGNNIEALHNYNNAINFDNTIFIAWNNGGNVLKRLGRFEEAYEYYSKAIKINNSYLDGYLNLGSLQLQLEKYDEAIETFEKTISIGGPLQSTIFIISALKSINKPEKMPLEMVMNLFDGYALDFDFNLREQLNYKVPEIMHSLFIKHKNFVNNILDLGCGTGISGVAFSGVSKIIDGVDISEQMLSLANEKKIYKNLICSDIFGYIENTNNKYDLILLCDVLIYIGDLNELFINLKRILLPNGYVAFSIENTTELDYELKKSLRYGHNIDYINNLSRDNNFNVIERKEVVLRLERGVSIDGCCFLLLLK